MAPLLRDLPCVALACIHQMSCCEGDVLEVCMLSLPGVRVENKERPMNSRYFNLLTLAIKHVQSVFTNSNV